MQNALHNILKITFPTDPSIERYTLTFLDPLPVVDCLCVAHGILFVLKEAIQNLS